MVLDYFISFLYAFYDICPKRVPKTTFGAIGRPVIDKNAQYDIPELLIQFTLEINILEATDQHRK